MPERGVVTMLLEERGIRKVALADVCGVGPQQLSKYVCGARRLNAEQRRAIEAEYAMVAAEVIGAFDAARASWESGCPVGKSRPVAPMDERVVEIAEPDDGEWYTIDEWKARFGEPGGAHDASGRAIGCGRAYFATEPDYCEE
jgi:hypothetical protein